MSDPAHARARTLAPLFAVALAIGVPTGLGLFTFGYGQGLSYFSKDPRACANCHVMQDYYDAWQRSSHHAVATCADCHLPHDTVGKLLAKADNGFFHSLVFTLGPPDVIQIKPRNRRITQRDCIDCHREVVDAVLPASPRGEAPSCVRCHADVGHGPR